MTALSQLPTGHRGPVAQLEGSRALRRRLMELGLLPGTPVRLVRRMRHGDLLEVEVRGCHLSLRRREADGLLLHAG